MSLHLLPVFVPLTVPLSGNQGPDILLGVVPTSIGPVVGSGPWNEEAMVLLLGPGEILLSSLPGGHHQLAPGHKPAYRELVNNAIIVELSLKLAPIQEKGKKLNNC